MTDKIKVEFVRLNPTPTIIHEAYFNAKDIVGQSAQYVINKVGRPDLFRGLVGTGRIGAPESGRVEIPLYDIDPSKVGASGGGYSG